MTTEWGLLTPQAARKHIEAIEVRCRWLAQKIEEKSLAGKVMKESYEARELRALAWMLTLAEAEWHYLVRADEAYDISGRVGNAILHRELMAETHKTRRKARDDENAQMADK